MAHLFRQIYVDEIDFEALTVEKVIDLVFTEMVYHKIQQLEEETQASATHREYFEALFDLSCFVWFQIYSDFERTAFINNLIDYVFCVCKLRYNSIV